MTAGEIKELAIQSATRYFDFITEKNRGITKVDVSSIAFIDGTAILKVNAPLKNTDHIFFEIEGIEYTSYFETAFYDHRTLSLGVDFKSPLKEIVAKCRPGDIFVLSDIRFLIDQLRDWYKTYGNFLQMPDFRSEVSPNLEAAANAGGSAEQVDTIAGIFSSTVSYVWGGPGTGKTKFVLSQCIKNYIDAGKKVLVLAPTNNALDQSLRGIIETLKEMGIQPRGTVIRLGTPTYEFYDEYPEVCEFVSKEKEVKKLNRIYERLLKAQRLLQEIDRCDKILDLHREFTDDIREITGINITSKYSELHNYLRLMLDKIHPIAKEYKSSKENEASSVQRISKLTHRWFVFRRKLKLEAEMKILAAEEERSKQLKEKLDEFLDSEIRCRKRIERYITDLNSAMTKKKLTVDLEYFRQGKNNFHAIETIIHDAESEKEKRLSFLEEYSSLYRDETELDALIKSHEQRIEKLYSQTAAGRVEKANVIAVTGDTFVSKSGFLLGYPNRDLTDVEPFDYVDIAYTLKIDHVFIDEAGYMPLIKGLLPFAYYCPVTYLGDHMQLPPVCEMDQKQIKEEINLPVFMWDQSSISAPSTFFYSRAELVEEYFSGEISFDFVEKFALSRSYRFGESLASILAGYVYTEDFCGNPDVYTKIVCLDAQRKKEYDKRENPAEAEVIKKHIETKQPEDFAVLTPYVKQRDFLKRYLKDICPPDSIMTIHTSQGREWDTVYLSVVDTTQMFFTNSKNTFTDGKRVINTAISRAKKKLIIVCDTEFWSSRDQQLIGQIVQIAGNDE